MNANVIRAFTAAAKKDNLDNVLALPTRLSKEAWSKARDVLMSRTGADGKPLTVTYGYELISISLSETLSNYRNGLRAAVRGFWSGVFDYADFLAVFGETIESSLTKAWIAGAKECGIAFDELSSTERQTLQQNIISQRMLMGKFADAIYAKRKSEGGKLTPLLNRVEPWVNYYRTVQIRAAAMACGDKKKVWRLNGKRVTKKHCLSCATFHGRTYRYSTWLAQDALPGSRRLRCGGYRCGCDIFDSDARITPGRFPASVLV